MYPRWIGYLVVMMLGIWGSGVGVAWGQHTVLVDFSTAQEPVPQGWELSVKSGTAHLQLVQENGKQALQMRSEQASYVCASMVRSATRAKRSSSTSRRNTPLKSWSTVS